jgi:4-amino-4-deoxy-L-arabinose transferase-like glycosyltransferase
MTASGTETLAGERPGILPATRSGRWACGAVLAVSFALRAGYVLLTRHSYHPLTDSLDFDLIATSLLHGHGFGRALVPPAAGPTAYRGPLYPITLAGAYAVFGHSWTVGRIEEAVIGTAMVAMIGVVAAQVFSRRVAAAGMALAAVYPTLVLYGTSLQLEPLLATLGLGSVAAALQHRRAPRGLLWPAVAGTLVGLALETRELGIVLVIPIAWLLWAPATSPWPRAKLRLDRRAVVAPVIAVLCTIVVLVPWTVRNEVRLHTFAPTSTSAGFTLAGTYNVTSASDAKFPTIWRPPFEDPQLYQLLVAKQQPGEAWINHTLTAATIRYVKAHPGYPLRVVFWNTVGLFDLQGPRVALYVAPYIPYSTRFVRLAVYSSYLVDLLAIGALLVPMTRKSPFALWAIPISAFVLIVLVSGNIRYRASIEPYIVLLAGVSIAALAERLMPNSSGSGVIAQVPALRPPLAEKAHL